jgi:hypothetical protein
MYKITKLPNGGELYEDDNGTKHWFLNGNYHREDGPAIIYHTGNKYWYLNGKRHREDGPAWEGYNGDKEYYLNGKYLSPIQFERLLKLKAFW